MARQVSITVQCGGKTLAPGRDFRALLLHQTLFDHHSLSIVVPFDSVEGSQAAFLGSAPGQFLGQPVSVTIAPDKDFDYNDGQGFSFKGLVTEMGTSKDSDGDSSITVQGYSACCLLADGVQKRTFLNQTLAAIFETVLAPYPGNLLTKQIQPRHKASIPYVAQYKESNFAFLSRLATEYAEWFFYDGSTLRLGPPAAAAEIEFLADGVHNSFHLGLSLHSTKVKFYEYNYQQHKHYTASTQAQEVAAMSQHPFGKLALKQSDQVFQQESHALAEVAIQSSGELTEEAKAFKAQRVADLVALQGSSDNYSLQLGCVIRVKGQGLGGNHLKQADFGTYRVVEVTHSIDIEGNYSNTFTAVPHLLELPPLNPSYAPPVGAHELAEVIDDEDPARLGRLRVRYHWPVAQPAAAETDWLRVLTPYSGDGKGQLFKPEVGSQVLIGYQGGLAEQPFVLGNMFHAHNKQGAKYSPAKNAMKGIQTAGGNKFVMQEQAGAQTILISNSNNKGTAILVSFQGDGSINITTNGPINLTAGKDITLQAGKSITLQANEDINLIAKRRVGVEAQDENVAVRARKELLLTAVEGDMTLEAAAKKMLVKAADNAEIVATGLVKLNGSDVKLNG